MLYSRPEENMDEKGIQLVQNLYQSSCSNHGYLEQVIMEGPECRSLVISTILSSYEQSQLSHIRYQLGRHLTLDESYNLGGGALNLTLHLPKCKTASS